MYRPGCSVTGCPTRQGDGDRILFQLPRVRTNQGEKIQGIDTRRRQLWISRIKVLNKYMVDFDNKRVCSRHFISGRPAGSLCHNDPDWVPSLHMGLEQQTSDLPSGIQESSQNVRVESLKPLLNSLPSAEVSGTGDGVRTCSIPECFNSSVTRPDARFFPIPEVKPSYIGFQLKVATIRRKAWLTRIGIQNMYASTDNYFVCSDHFATGKPADLSETNSIDWFPMMKIPYLINSRSRRRRNLLLTNTMEGPSGLSGTESNAVDHRVEEPTEDPLGIPDEEPGHFFAVPEETNLPPQRPDSRDDHSYYIRPEKVADTRTSSPQEDPLGHSPHDTDVVVKMEALEEEPESSGQLGRGPSGNFRVDLFFGEDDQKVAYYTGFKGLEKLWLVFRFVEDRLDANGSRPDESALPLFEQFCLALMYLRHGFHPQDLAYRFEMEREDVATFIERGISILYQILVPAHVVWPRRTQSVSGSANKTERNRCIAIVETVRVPECSSSQQDSQFLVAATPSGSFLFVSKCFAGNSNPEVIWTTSGLFDNLEPGDLVLTESGRSLYVVRPASSSNRSRPKRQRKQPVKAEGALPNPISNIEDDRLEFYRLGNYEAEGILHTVTVNAFESLRRRFAVIRQGFDALSFASPLSLDQVVNVCCALHNASPSDPTPATSAG